MAIKGSIRYPSLFSIMPKNIPLVFDRESSKELFAVNIHRERLLCLILCTIVIFLLCLDYAVSDGWMVDNHIFLKYSSLHTFLFIICVVYLGISTIFTKTNNYILIGKILHIALNTSILFLCAMLAVQCFTEGKEPFSYVCAMFGIASLILFTFVERIIVFILPCIGYIAGVLLNRQDPYYALSYIIYILLLNALAFFISNIHYKSYRNSLIQNKIISSDKEEIEKLRAQAVITLENRTNFFANISHELRTPLTILYSSQQMLDLLLEEAKAPAQHGDVKKYMKIMRQNILRLVRLIGNLIDITKIEAGYFYVNLENSDIVRITREIAQSVSSYVEDIGITFTFHSELEKAVIACDPDNVERILLNLLSNAIKYTDRGGRISIGVRRNDRMIQICVRDTGIGIPEEMQKAIFDRFVQTNKTVARTGGSGIGLSLVKALTEMHQGSIDLKSKPGEGSEFIVSFPDRQLPDQKTDQEILLSPKHNIDRISYEFSDIYK